MDKEKELPLQFKPLTEGLGLNHFAEGLPYSPVKPGQKTMMHLDVSVPRMPNYEKARLQVGTVESRGGVKGQAAAEVEKVSEEVVGENISPRFLSRVLAFSIDVVLATGGFFAVVYGGLTLNGYEISEVLSLVNVQMVLLLGGLFVGLFLGYFLVQEVGTGRTMGKALLGINLRAAGRKGDGVDCAR